jgi:hypothetical protein
VEPQWINAYTLLVLRLNQAIAHHTQNTMLLDYYGPPDMEAQVAQEAPRPPRLLLEDIEGLRNTLGIQTIEPPRTAYLTKLLTAYETLSRRLAGERIPLREQAWTCFDIQVELLPESDFEYAHSLYDEALRGDGTLAERLAQWGKHYTVPQAKVHLIPAMIQQAVREAHRRTHAIIPLPPTDEVEIAPIRGQPVRAMAHYLGNYRSRILINPDYPFNISDLLYVVCHEAYPGHLAELMLKEQFLLHQKGYGEQAVSFLITPPFVLSEGIALWAHEVVFPSAEAEAWLAEHIYPQVGILPDGSDLKKIQHANDILFGVRCNAALMLDDGYSEPEVLRYLMRHALLDETGAHRALQSLQRPYCEAYPFTYFYGRRLLAPFLQGQHRDTILRRLLTHQCLPSDFAQGGVMQPKGELQ